MQNYRQLIVKIKKFDFKKSRYAKILLAGFCLVIFIGVFSIIKMLVNYYSTEVYEAAIVVYNQKNPDPIKDAKSSFKIGDVLVLKKEGHNWSNLEKISYLLIKIELTKSQSEKIVMSKYRKYNYEDLSKTEMDELNSRLKTSGLSEVPKEVVNLRQYRINMEKYFKDFDPLVLLHKQPYLYTIYNWDIVQKKINVL